MEAIKSSGNVTMNTIADYCYAKLSRWSRKTFNLGIDKKWASKKEGHLRTWYLLEQGQGVGVADQIGAMLDQHGTAGAGG